MLGLQVIGAGFGRTVDEINRQAAYCHAGVMGLGIGTRQPTSFQAPVRRGAVRLGVASRALRMAPSSPTAQPIRHASSGAEGRPGQVTITVTDPPLL
jgi:hypothetical protein